MNGSAKAVELFVGDIDRTVRQALSAPDIPNVHQRPVRVAPKVIHRVLDAIELTSVWEGLGRGSRSSAQSLCPVVHPRTLSAPASRPLAPQGVTA